MELIVGRGIDDILFGMREAEIIEAIGPPDKVYEEEGDRRLRFNKRRCSFWFREERLHWIRCASPELTLFGERLHGRPTEEVMSFLCSKLADPPDLDDYDDWESHTFPESVLELQFEYDTLSEVCFGQLWGGDDEPIWPVA